MRELLENALYAPTSGRFKVYIIDEVHMLSRSAFNAMLKTLEEPPAAREVRPRHDRSAENPGDGAVALPAVQSEADSAAQIRGQLENVLGKEGVAFRAAGAAI